MKHIHPTIRLHSILVLTLIMTLPILLSCSDFVDHPDEPDSSAPTATEPETNATPSTPTEPNQAPKPSNGNVDQRYWKACEAERVWAFNARLIDANALRLFQQRNLAPVFIEPGVRQSGIEGWYACVRA